MIKAGCKRGRRERGSIAFAGYGQDAAQDIHQPDVLLFLRLNSERPWKSAASVRGEPGKNNAAGWLFVGIDELTEILVLGQQHAILSRRKSQHGIVI